MYFKLFVYFFFNYLNRYSWNLQLSKILVLKKINQSINQWINQLMNKWKYRPINRSWSQYDNKKSFNYTIRLNQSIYINVLINHLEQQTNHSQFSNSINKSYWLDKTTKQFQIYNQQLQIFDFFRYDHSINQSINKSIVQSYININKINQFSKSTNIKTISKSIVQSVQPSINKSISKSIDQSTNQSTNV